MTETAATFKAKSTIKSADLEHRQKINFNIGRYNAVVPLGKHQFSDVHLARERAKNIKWRAIETLDQQLEEFEKILPGKAGKVIWAENAQQALERDFKYLQRKKLQNTCEEQEHGYGRNSSE